VAACGGPTSTPGAPVAPGALVAPGTPVAPVAPATSAVDAGAAPVAPSPAPPVEIADAAESSRTTPRPVSWSDDRRKAQFHPLGGGTSRSTAIAVSADGSTPVGIAQLGGGRDEAVRWRDGKMWPLGTLDLPGIDSSTPWALSRDGDVVVGESTATQTTSVAVVWRDDAGPERLPLPPGSDDGAARAVSRDGSIVVGCLGGCDAVVRWKAGAVAVVSAPDGLALAAHPLSEDGAVLAGTVTGEPEKGVRVSGKTVTSPGDGTRVEAISDDGKVLVGNVGADAVLWRGKAITRLGTLAGYDACYARSVSADGARVIGNCTRHSRWAPRAGREDEPPPVDPQASAAFVWDKRDGMRTIADALAAAGVTVPAGWWLDEAFDICGYGVTIVGDGKSPSSPSEAWMAVLPR
jgi:uncharacterized membrane protein